MTLVRPHEQPPIHLEEEILVIKRSLLFSSEEAWHGLKTDSFSTYFERVEQFKEFHPRSVMEIDPTYKQIIPYLIFRHNDRYFLMQRTGHASEQRLKNKFSLGIGGHINKEDLQADSVMGWAEREFKEEVSFEGTYTVKPIGILNDDTTQVGLVHCGFVLLIEGSSPAISVKSELKSGELLTLEESALYYHQMENWSQLLFTYLTTAKD